MLPKSITACVGKTPLVKLSHLGTRKDITVLGKLEMQNPGGSIKDRTAVSLIQDGIKRGRINAETHIVESSSGNLGVGLAQVCCQLGLKLTIVVDSRTNNDVIRLVSAYGGRIEVVNETGPGESLLDARLRRVRELAEEQPNTVWSNQYSNPANPTAHHETMGEIIRQTGGRFDQIHIATSTCGTLAGCREMLNRRKLNPEVVAVDANGSRIFQKPEEAADATRLIPGHGSSRKSVFLRSNDADRVSLVSDRDCVDGCRRLLRREGILAGGSSGGVVTSFLRGEHKLPAESVVVLILCDRGERYLDTVYNDEWVSSNL